MRIQKMILAIAATSIMSSCTHRIGDLTTLGARELDQEKEYQELRRDVIGKDITLHNLLIVFGPVHTPHIEDAVSKAISKVPGGEYMKNVVVKERYNPFIAFSTRVISVRGDVWGVPQKNVINIHGFHVDDEVIWKIEKAFGKDKWYNGTVIAIAQESISVIHKGKNDTSIITEVPNLIAFKKSDKLEPVEPDLKTSDEVEIEGGESID
jgi:hypothetical protein